MQTAALNLEKFSAIQAQGKSSLTSDKYSFIPTTRVIDVLAQNGWMPVKAAQAGTRVEGKAGFQNHLIRFRNTSFNTALKVGDTLPEIVLKNSHCGGASFQLMAGLFRLVCSNGLVVDDHEFETIRIRHTGYTDDLVQKAITNIVDACPATLEQVASWQAIELSENERLAFAASAIELKFDGDKYAVEPKQLLARRRYGDNATDLYTTMNVVQENLIRGGVRQRRRDGSRVRSREVKSIDENIKLNKALWTLTSRMAELRA